MITKRDDFKPGYRFRVKGTEGVFELTTMGESATLWAMLKGTPYAKCSTYGKYVYFEVSGNLFGKGYKTEAVIPFSDIEKTE